MMTAIQCPSPTRLRDLSLGRLPEDASDELLDHVNECATCQSELETIGDADADDSLILSIRSPDEADGLAHEPECHAAVIAALGAIGGRTPSPDSSDLPAFPVSIGEYQIVRPLGRGGMGNVYLARHTKLGRFVALKVLAGHRLADAKMKERFEAEMRAVGRLSHPGIVTAHDAREIDGTAVLVTEFIDGMDLAQLVARTGPIEIANACELIRQVAVSLQYTSDQGFVHRDVKPSNIMLSTAGEVKLLDLGLARLQEPAHETSELTGTGQAMGTADYIAPEQVTDSRSVDVRADIYALGCTLFKLLTGHAPFAGPQHATAFAKMTAHVSSPPPTLAEFLPDADTRLVKLTTSMLAKDPASRPQTPMQVAEKLKPFAGDANLSALIERAETITPQSAHANRPATKTTPQTQSWRRRTVPITAAIAAGFFGLFIGFLGGFLIRIQSPDGSVVTMNAPEGSEITITPDTNPTPIEPINANTDPTPIVETPFFKFAILATKEESDQMTFGEDMDEKWRWYTVESRVNLDTAIEVAGERYHLVHEADAFSIRDHALREKVEYVQSSGSGKLELHLSEEAGKQMKQWSGENLGKRMAIIINGKIRMAPKILEAVGRDISILGHFSREEVQFLMDALNTGLAEPLSKTDDDTTLGSDLERLQGVWRITDGPSNTLIAFKGYTFFVANDEDLFAAGDVTHMTAGDHEPKEILIKNLLPDGPREQLATVRFRTSDQVEFRMLTLSVDQPGGNSVVMSANRVGDLPANNTELAALRDFPGLIGLDPIDRNKLFSALMVIFRLHHKGLQAHLNAKGRAQPNLSVSDSSRNLEQIGFGFQNFNSVVGIFPASTPKSPVGAHTTKDPSQLPPFSWRVAILPFIDELELCNQYRFDEPWDSEANLKLLPQMPTIYRRPDAPEDQPVGHANYQGIANGRSALGTDAGVKLDDITDGASNTLLIMETESSVPWTKPQDLNELPEFSENATFRGVLADGSVLMMKPIDLNQLKARITRNGGEPVQP